VSSQRLAAKLPIIICIVLLGSPIVFTSGSAVAPFIYTLFEQAPNLFMSQGPEGFSHAFLG
jgi:hypothetical protein